MPATVSHALSMTTPDNPAYENKPSNWNATHALTINATGSEISAAFSNANGISFGVSAGAITGSHNAITTGRASNDAVGLNTALTAGPLAWTVNSAGISLNAGSAAGTSSGFTGGASISGSFTHNTAGLAISLSHPAWITTGALSNHSHGVSFTSGSVGFQTLSFTNSNGISFNSGTQGIFGSHNAITTGRASSDAIGLNTAQTNVTWTVNSSGLSFNAAGYAGTGTSATNASVTLNSNGLQISVAAPGGAAITQSIGMSTQTAGGATGGTTGYATGDDVLYHFVPGSNITMSQSVNGASATLSIYGTAPVTLSSYHEGLTGQTLLVAPVNGSISVVRFQCDQYISGTEIAFNVYQSLGTSAAANTYGQQWTIQAMVFTNDTANLRLMSLSSGSTQTTYTLASNSAGATQITGSGVRPITCPLNMNMTPGQYLVAFGWSTNTFSSGTATTSLARTVSMIGRGAIMSASWAPVSAYDQATGSSVNRLWPQGVLSNAISSIPLTISHSQFSINGVAHSNANLAFFIRA